MIAFSEQWRKNWIRGPPDDTTSTHQGTSFYAAENGSTKAAWLFSKLLNSHWMVHAHVVYTCHNYYNWSLLRAFRKIIIRKYKDLVKISQFFDAKISDSTVGNNWVIYIPSLLIKHSSLKCLHSTPWRTYTYTQYSFTQIRHMVSWISVWTKSQYPMYVMQSVHVGG